MEMTFRWYGKDDPVKLEYIKQIPGMKGIVTAIYDIPVGEVWPLERILELNAWDEVRVSLTYLRKRLCVARGNHIQRRRSLPNKRDRKITHRTQRWKIIKFESWFWTKKIRSRLLELSIKNTRLTGERSKRDIMFKGFEVDYW